MLLKFFRCPRLHFDGMAWTIRVGFRIVSGPFRYGVDAERMLMVHERLIAVRAARRATRLVAA